MANIYCEQASPSAPVNAVLHVPGHKAVQAIQAAPAKVNVSISLEALRAAVQAVHESWRLADAAVDSRCYGPGSPAEARAIKVRDARWALFVELRDVEFAQSR
jgi:hypothetical protein